MMAMKAMLQSARKILGSYWLPWSLVGVVLLTAVVIEVLRRPGIEALSGVGEFLFWLLVLTAVGLVYLTINRFIELYEQRSKMEKQLADAGHLVEESYQRLEAVFQVSQKFVDASDENEVLEPVLRLLADLTGAEGVSFVPLDEHGQPQTAVCHGDLPFPVMEAWVEYLASPGVRDRCRSCETPESLDKPLSCPLLKSPFAEAVKLMCLPVRRGGRDYGVVTLFLSKIEQLDQRTRSFLRALIDETALGLEGVHLRRRELAALRQMQSLRQKTDLRAMLSSLLENVYRAMEADFALLVVPQLSDDEPRIDLKLGDIPAPALPFLDGVLQGIMASREPMMLGDVTGDPSSAPGLRSLVAAPMLSPERSLLGAILVGNRRSRTFHQRQLALLQTIAGQVALVIQNTSLIADLEYKTMMLERTRLAREIHDGLAQTLGFLKLQAAQMRSYMNRGEYERMRQSVDLCYTTLTEAYQDARQAIDGLRVSPAECGLSGWLDQTIRDFQEVSGLQVQMPEVDVNTELPPEVHAQLIRIVQEALSNIRKHAQASRVEVTCSELGNDLVLEICDNGIGFSPEDVSVPSRHGLRGMRERADLIGADFQVVSRPLEGTTVRVRLPLKGIGEVIV